MVHALCAPVNRAQDRSWSTGASRSEVSLIPIDVFNDPLTALPDGMTSLMEPHDRRSTGLPLLTKILLLCGAVGPLLFVVAFFIEGSIRPSYNQWLTTISTLSLGDRGWVQTANFCLFGLSTLCIALAQKRSFSSGPASRSGPVLFAVMGLGLITAGLFVTDPILGYPPTAPVNGSPTLHGTIHNLASLTVFIALPAACFVMGRRFSSQSALYWAAYSKASGFAIIFLVVWFFVSVARTTGHPEAGKMPPGLLERFFSIIGCCWISLTAFRQMDRQR